MSKSSSKPSKVTVKLKASPSTSGGSGKTLYRTKARLATHLHTGKRK